MKKLKIDGLQIRIHENRDQAAIDAASAIGKRIVQLLNSQQQVNMIFAAAPSQNELLLYLSKLPGINWTRVNAFHMDEYVGLPKNDPRSFAYFLHTHLFSFIPLGSIHLLDCWQEDLEKICRNYESELKKFPADIVCMGIGENGHIAFNEPNESNLEDKQWVKIVRLDPRSRQQQVSEGNFSSLAQVPTHALTLTIPAMFAGQYLFCMVPGERKAKSVYDTVYGPIGKACPASILRLHPQAVLYLDKWSSALLQVR
jgi:glucosamine-6-phosphate deaminase